MQRRFRPQANFSASPGLMDIPMVAVFARMLVAPEPQAEAFRQALSLPNRRKGRDHTWQSEEERAHVFPGPRAWRLCAGKTERCPRP